MRKVATVLRRLMSTHHVHRALLLGRCVKTKLEDESSPRVLHAYASIPGMPGLGKSSSKPVGLTIAVSLSR